MLNVVVAQGYTLVRGHGTFPGGRGTGGGPGGGTGVHGLSEFVTKRCLIRPGLVYLLQWVTAPRPRPVTGVRHPGTLEGETVFAHELPPDPLLTPSEVAHLFRVDPKTVTRWAQAGKLTAVRTLGGHRRYREAEVRAMLHGAVPSQDRLYGAG